ncbi:MAG: hypothetical protein ABIH76_02630 [Candidatus Bathyarchaeota archaeon]
MWCNDTGNASPGWEEKQTNYANIETDLQTTFSIDDDRGSISQSITASGTVTYEGSSTAPADAEFTSVSVYDSGDSNRGSDVSISSGAWSVNFDSPATVGLETYNLYVDMLDADYVDGELTTPTDTFITDRYVVNDKGVTDSRTNVDESETYYFKLRSEYDSRMMGSGETVTLNGTESASWNAGQSRWEFITSKSTVQQLVHYVDVISDTFSTTALQAQSSNTTAIIWDQGNFTLTSLSGNTQDPTFIVIVQLDYDDTNATFNAGSTLKAWVDDVERASETGEGNITLSLVANITNSGNIVVNGTDITYSIDGTLNIPYDISASSLSNQGDQAVTVGYDKDILVTWDNDALINSTAVSIENGKLWMRLIASGTTYLTENTTLSSIAYGSNSETVTLDCSGLPYGSYALNTTLLQMGSEVTLDSVITVFSINPLWGGVAITQPAGEPPILHLNYPEVDVRVGETGTTQVALTLENYEGLKSYEITEMRFGSSRGSWIAVNETLPKEVTHHQTTFPDSSIIIHVTPDLDTEQKKYAIPFTGAVTDDRNGKASSTGLLIVNVLPPLFPELPEVSITAYPPSDNWAIFIILALGIIGVGVIAFLRRD